MTTKKLEDAEWRTTSRSNLEIRRNGLLLLLLLLLLLQSEKHSYWKITTDDDNSVANGKETCWTDNSVVVLAQPSNKRGMENVYPKMSVTLKLSLPLERDFRVNVYIEISMYRMQMSEVIKSLIRDRYIRADILERDS